MKIQEIRKPFTYFSLIILVLTLGFYTRSYAQASKAIISIPITHQYFKTFTKITVGKNPLSANVTLDTGSAMLVLEARFVRQYRKDDSYQTLTMAYGGGKQVVKGKVVYADVTLNTPQGLVAKNVPILKVPNGTFKGKKDGIMGVEMSNQTSVWMHLPAPYNKMMVIDGANLTASFGELSDDQVNEFSTVQLKQVTCNNKADPGDDEVALPCWATRKIPVTYTFKSPDGKVIYQESIRTIFDTGGDLTHFWMQALPSELKSYVEDDTFNGILSATLQSDNKGIIKIPTTQKVKIFISNRDVVNSGYRLFHSNRILFDASDGVIGFK